MGMKLAGPAGNGTVVGRRPILLDAMTPITDALAAAGIRVLLDIKVINPPCAFLHPPEVTFRFREGDFTARHKLLLICSGSDRTASYRNMSDLLLDTQQALAYRAVVAVPAQVETSDLSTFLTAYELSWTENVRQA